MNSKVFQKVDFTFPDPDNPETMEDSMEIELEPSTATDIESLDLEAPYDTPEETEAVEEEVEVVEDEVEEEVTAAEEDVEVEEVDDVPPADRNRVPSEPPEDVTAEELEQYSAKVRNRIKHFNKGYHDERRAKEAALRESEEMQRVVKQLMSEKAELQTTVMKDRELLITQARDALATDVAQAQAEYREAYDMGNPDALLAAQEKLTAARMAEQQLDNLTAEPVQTSANQVQHEQQLPEGDKPSVPRARPDQRAMDWKNDNAWFGSDKHEPETAYALGVHKQLTQTEGISPQTDEYYSRLNESMHGKFPELFGGTLRQETDTTNDEPEAAVVAPVTRSTSPRKVTLTRTQVALARKLGITPAQYAKQAAIEARKQNG